MKNIVTISAITISALPVISVKAIDKSEPPQKPNLLFIWTDQQTDSTMAVYGNDKFKVPNMNALADESIVFRNSYVVQPVSTPSRGTALTGLYPHRHGALVNNRIMLEQSRCLPELLNDPSYATGYYGKWHLGRENTAQHGFQEMLSTEPYPEGYPKGETVPLSGYQRFLMERGFTKDQVMSMSRTDASKLEYDLTKPKYLELSAIDFLERHKDQPFVLYVNYLEPHHPYNGPFNNLHDGKELGFSPAYDCELSDDDPVRYHLMAKQRSREQWESDNQNYAGLCHSVDLSLGAILKKLEELGLRENTIVVFTSDHGEMMGAHRLREKSVMYEPSVRVPLLMRVPWINGYKQEIIRNNVTNIDLVPTILELMGKDPESYDLQGKSLVPWMKGMSIPDDDGYIYLLWNNNNDDAKFAEIELKYYNNAAFRTVIAPDGWKLSISDRDKHQLFNLKADPYECNNLYYRPGHEDKIRHLTRKIRKWQERTGDTSFNYDYSIVELPIPFDFPDLKPPVFPDNNFDIRKYGAKTDNIAANTKAVRQAIEACVKKGGGKVIIPKGVWDIGPIHLKSNVNLHLEDGAELRFSKKFDDFLPVVLVQSGDIFCYNYSPFVYAHKCENIAVTGNGILNGQGQAWWRWKVSGPNVKKPREMVKAGIPVEQRIFGTEEARIRTRIVSFIECKNVFLEGITLKDSPSWNLHPVYCENVIIRNVKISAHGPNNDGIDLNGCKNVLIEDCDIDAGDDNICLKSGIVEEAFGIGRPCENIVIRRCITRQGHGGFVIGAETSANVRNVLVEDCLFSGTDRGLRFKSCIGRGGIVENIWIRDISMSNIRRRAIDFDLQYDLEPVEREKKDGKLKYIPVFRNIYFENIVCDKSRKAIHLSGNPEAFLSELYFKNIRIYSERGIETVHVNDIVFDNVKIIDYGKVQYDKRKTWQGSLIND